MFTSILSELWVVNSKLLREHDKAGDMGADWLARNEAGSGGFKLRRYDPAIGRFTQPDPIGQAGGDNNMYRYVSNDPTSAIDPSGLGQIDPNEETRRINDARNRSIETQKEISDEKAREELGREEAERMQKANERVLNPKDKVDIKGESKDDKHKGEIEVLSWSWGIQGKASLGGGSASGKATIREMKIVKRVDKASTALMGAVGFWSRNLISELMSPKPMS